MKRFPTLACLIVLLTLLLSACSSGYRPAPVGDKIVWSSHDERPEWTVKAPEVDQDDRLVFVGQSLYHSTERAARINAEAQAASQAALYLSREVRSQYLEQGQGGSQESDIQNPDITLDQSIEVKAEQMLFQMSPKDLYLEQWRDGKTKFWRAFLLMEMPKKNL